MAKIAASKAAIPNTIYAVFTPQRNNELKIRLPIPNHVNKRETFKPIAIPRL